MKRRFSLLKHAILPILMGLQFNMLPAWADSQSESAVYLNQGNEQFEQKNYAESVPYYTKAIALDPESMGAFMKRGLAYQQIGQYPQAIEDYTKAIQLDRDTKITRPGAYNVDAYLNRGYAYMSLGEFELARTDFDHSIVINPFDKRCYMMKGLVLAKLGQDQKAMGEFNAALFWDGKYTEAYLNRGSLYMKQGLYENAIADYSKAIQFNSNPQDDRALRLRAIAYIQKANHISSQAQADLVQAKKGGK